MPLRLNRWGKHQNKQQSAWQAEAIGMKIDRVRVPTSAAEGGRKKAVGRVSNKHWPVRSGARGKRSANSANPGLLCACCPFLLMRGS